MVDHRVISFEGIRVPGAPKLDKSGNPTGDVNWITVDWRTFAGMSPDERAQVTSKAQMTPDEAKTLDQLLAKNQNITWDLTGPQNLLDYGSDKSWVDKGYGKLSDQ